MSTASGLAMGLAAKNAECADCGGWSLSTESADLVFIYFAGCVVAYLIGCLLGVGIVIAARSAGNEVRGPVSGVLLSGVGPLFLWLIGYPIALLTMASLGYVFGGA